MTDETPHDTTETSLSNESDLTYEIDEEEQPSEAVARAVATLTQSSILELEPLYHVIDPDALDGLFETPETSSDSSITIRFNGCQVTVTGEVVHVNARDDEGS